MLQPSDRAPGLMVAEGVVLPESAEIGAHVVIHAGTRVGEGARLQDGAVLGKPVVLGVLSRAPRDSPPPLEIGAGSTVGTGAVVLAGVRVGTRAVIADQAHVRERSSIGDESVIGRGCAIEHDVSIGARVRIQSNCYITAHSEVEDDVFVAPSVSTTNDNTMGRHGPGHRSHGATLRRACRVGGGAVLLPGIEVGEEAFVGAGALVTRHVPARAVVIGAPARQVREVPDEDLLEHWA